MMLLEGDRMMDLALLFCALVCVSIKYWTSLGCEKLLVGERFVVCRRRSNDSVLLLARRYGVQRLDLVRRRRPDAVGRRPVISAAIRLHQRSIGQLVGLWSVRGGLVSWKLLLCLVLIER